MHGQTVSGIFIHYPAGECVITQYSWNSHSDSERKQDAFQAMVVRRPLVIFRSLLDLDHKDIDEAKAG
ncbi:MAG: hypothetical protein LBR93_01335 [Treponema sp.]|nr:hypothetical protein [Treponema sp.]